MKHKYTNIIRRPSRVIYPEMSFKIIGLAFNVFNDIGYGMNEKYYQRALTILLEKENIPFQKEKLVKLNYQARPVGNYFLDFVVADKIVVELKIRSKLGYTH